MLEERGFSTVAIASVRAQAEKTRPPRALWTTSQLGRPLGEPAIRHFSAACSLAALGLLERTDGPVILEDFNEDPRDGGTRRTGERRRWQKPASRWRRPMLGPQHSARSLSALLPLWRTAQTRFGRTTVGFSFQAPAAWPRFATRFLAGELPAVPELDTPALALRMLC